MRIKRLFVVGLPVVLMLAVIEPTGALVFSNPSPITINDATAIATANPYSSNITVSGLTGSVTNVTVSLLNVNHSFPDDFDVLLVGPGGDNLILMSDTGGSDDLFDTTVTFDDLAASQLPDGTTFATFGNGWSVTITSANPATTFVNFTPVFSGDGARGRATPYSSTINVSGVIGGVTSLSVTLTGIDHLNPDDLDIILVSPQGRRLILMSDAGGTTDITGVNLTFDDAGASQIPDAGPVVAGTFRPTNSGTNPGIAALRTDRWGTTGDIPLASR